MARFPDGKDYAKFKEIFPFFEQSWDEIAGGYETLTAEIANTNTDREHAALHQTLFLLFGACSREFEEVLLLALNGYGSGATKLVRGLYERTVTTQFLMKKPDRMTDFIDYSEVHWMKLLRTADVGNRLSKERRDEINNNFEKVKEHFTITLCAECETTTTMHSWHKSGVPSQAEQVSGALKLFRFHGYDVPTFFLHTTYWGITQQGKEGADGKWELHNEESEFDYSKTAVLTACVLMAHLAVNANTFFKLNQDAAVSKITRAVTLIEEKIAATL